jgi:haloacetate dehalogenase
MGEIHGTPYLFRSRVGSGSVCLWRAGNSARLRGGCGQDWPPSKTKRTHDRRVCWLARGRSPCAARYAQRDSASTVKSSAPASFKTAEIEAAGNQIFYPRYGQGPPILLVHGFPRASLMWRFLAPQLAGNHTVVCVDLRGYGRSGIPASADDHLPHSKRAMAEELVKVMVKLGFPTFTLIGHDRGGRVAYRTALDHPKNVERLAVFHVIPILEAWSRSDARFAQTYWPRILLSQKRPLPESYLLDVPKAYNPFGRGSFGPEILKEYVSTYRDPGHLASMGAARTRAGDERGPLLPGREPRPHRCSHQAVPRCVGR